MSASDTLHRPPGPFVLWRMLRAYLGGGRGRLCVLHSFKQTDWIRIWNESSCWSGGIRRGRLSDSARQGYSVARNQYTIRRIHIHGARPFLQLSSALCACRWSQEIRGQGEPTQGRSDAAVDWTQLCKLRSSDGRSGLRVSFLGFDASGKDRSNSKSDKKIPFSSIPHSRNLHARG